MAGPLVLPGVAGAAQPQNGSDERPTGVAGVLARVMFLDLMVGLALLWDRYPFPGVNQPTGVLVMVLAIGLAITRRPTQRVRWTGAILALYALMVAWAAAVAQMSGLGWQQRALKLVILVGFALAIASGRLHLRSILIGLLVGLLVNVPLFYAGVTPNDYPPYLTGFLLDKNVAGLMYATVMMAGLVLYRRWPGRLVHLAVFGTAVFLTGSRTSMSAAAVGLVWLLLRNRLALLPRLGLVGLLVWALVVVEERFARAGIFADREGTDWFRQQITLATEAKLARSPWYGNGLTTAWVQLTPERTMFFHDSYAALRVEGGWVMVAVMLVLTVVLGLGLFRQGKVSPALLFSEAAVVVVLVCAWKLGEVFFTTPAFLALGLAWRLRWGVPHAAPPAEGWPEDVGAPSPAELVGPDPRMTTW